MKKQIAAVVALACVSSFSFAQQNKAADVGPYAGISGGRASTSFTSQDFSTNGYAVRFPTSAGLTTDTTDTRNTAWRIFLGYKYDQNWAIEGAYTSLGESTYTISGSGTYLGTAAYKVDNSAWSAAVKGTLPVSKEFDIFALLGGTSNYSKTNWSATTNFAAVGTGLGATSGSASKSRGYGMGGLGVEYKPTPNVGIRAEYHNYGKFGDQITNAADNTGRSEVDAWLLGVSVKF